MPTKKKAPATRAKKKRQRRTSTSVEIAERRIKAWLSGRSRPRKLFDTNTPMLDLAGLRLKEFPESLRRARERREAGEIEVLTVKLEPCAVDEDPFLKEFQRLAPKFKSIVEAPLRSVAWEQVRKDLLPVITRVRMRLKRSP